MGRLTRWMCFLWSLSRDSALSQVPHLRGLQSMQTEDQWTLAWASHSWPRTFCWWTRCQSSQLALVECCQTCQIWCSWSQRASALTSEILLCRHQHLTHSWHIAWHCHILSVQCPQKPMTEPSTEKLHGLQSSQSRTFSGHLQTPCSRWSFQQHLQKRMSQHLHCRSCLLLHHCSVSSLFEPLLQTLIDFYSLIRTLLCWLLRVTSSPLSLCSSSLQFQQRLGTGSLLAV